MKGSCLCSKIQYTVSVEPSDCCLCYCQVCRKLSGSFAGAYGRVPRSSFELVKGQELLTEFWQTKHTMRVFCSVCGSQIYSTHRLAPDNLYLTLGTLEAKNFDITYQQFTASKVGCVEPLAEVESYSHWPKWVSNALKADPGE